MSWNLPPGCTDADVDRAAGGYDLDPGEDPDNLLVDQEVVATDDGCAADCPF